MSWDDIINPISNAILQFFSPFINWVMGLINPIIDFISGISQLLFSVVTLFTGLFGDIYNSNPYGAITFGLIISGISIVFFLRIYNILAGITIFGWKIPKL